MNDDQLLRYSRQIMLPQMDVTGQQKLLQSHVLIVGLGGLGSPVAMYLAAAGVGTLTLADFDDVDLSNLQRQIAHSHNNIGLPKVTSASQTLNSLNPETQIHTITNKLEGDELVSAIQAADLVVDASDNFTTRFAINRACAATHTPLVSGAAIRLEGQISVFLHQQDDQPCYHCLYSDHKEEETATCSENGVLSPVVGIIGSIQATEAIKLLTGIGSSLAGRLLTLDASTMEFREIRLRQDPSCPVCGNQSSRRSAVS
jgi:molybdopterin/thiamine biosynthesis adenylyltransferase